MKKIINAHMHIFTGNFVSPYLARTIIFWPFYYLVNTAWIISLFRTYYSLKYRKDFAKAKSEEAKHRLWQRIYAGRRRARKKVNFRFFITSRWYFNIFYKLIIFWISIIATLFILEFISSFFTFEDSILDKINEAKSFLTKIFLYYNFKTYLKTAWVILVVLFIKWSREFIFFVLRSIFPILKKLITKNTIQLLERYMALGRFAFYNSQQRIAQRALHQLPPNSGIVILPMDMEYMGAGKTKMPKNFLQSKKEKIAKGWEEKDFADVYKYQMRELWDVVKKPKENVPKETYYPFVFLDPRRIKKERKKFFDYRVEDNKMVLEPCFIKTYIEDRRFSGFKIYPPLGYYPFDESLLPIWRYAAENSIPITSHCVIGTIYYRGKKKKEWNYHPIFKEEINKEDYQAQLLPQSKSINYQRNFMHPLNYLCLLEEKFLKEVIRQTDTNSEARELFGYSETEDTIACNLSSLKICLAHYGGEDEWMRYLEQDRDNYSQRLMRDPVEAIKFMENSDGKFSWYKINDLWNKADWYSLICSLLIRYENVYADLSYIISKKPIYPLLKYTLEKGDNYCEEHEAYMAEPDINKKATHYTGKNKLRSRILFGTDFYVVRNHNSDKDLFVETKALLDDKTFDLIARENPYNFLFRI